MGLILTKYWRLLWSGKEHKVILVGLDNAGKTTILYHFMTKDTIDTKPTIGSNVEEITYGNLRFYMYDIGGQESLRNSWSTYYNHTEFVIIVIDSADIARLPIIRDQLQSMLEHEDLAHSNLLVLANKQDLPTALPASTISTQLGLTSIKNRRWQIQGCSAIKGEGLEDALQWLANNVA